MITGHVHLITMSAVPSGTRGGDRVTARRLRPPSCEIRVPDCSPCRRGQRSERRVVVVDRPSAEVRGKGRATR